MLGSRILKAFMENRSYNAAERIMMCALIALSGTFFFYDYYQSFADIARIVITVLIFVIWFFCALCAGKDRQWGFMAFGYMYWAIPYIYMIFYNSRDNVRGYSKWLSLFNKIADMLFAKPFEFAAVKFETEAETLACVVIVGTTVMFLSGVLLRLFYTKKHTVSEEKIVQIKSKDEHKLETKEEPKSLSDYLGSDN